VGVAFSDKLVNVCTTLANMDALRAEPWAQVETCAANLQAGIAELRGMQKAIERLTRQQLAAPTMGGNLSVLFEFAERIGHACYAELVRSRLPLRLAEARRAVSLLGVDAEALGKMQAEVMRRDPAVSAETAHSRVRLRLEELEQLLESVVPVADAVDRRTAELTRRSLARFRYLQETTSESRAQVQAFFEALNLHGAGRRVAEMDDEAAEFPALRLHDARLMAGLVVPDKAERARQYHHKTVHVALEITGALGYESAAQIACEARPARNGRLVGGPVARGGEVWGFFFFLVCLFAH
jgi:hypothetical protein